MIRISVMGVVLLLTAVSASTAWGFEVLTTSEISSYALVPVVVESVPWTVSVCADRGGLAIDQNQPDSSAYIADFSQTCLAQSFQQTNGNIAGAGIFLQHSVGGSDTVTIQLWTNLPTSGGTMLTEAGTTGQAGTWCDVFWEAEEVSPGTTYFLVFTGNTTLGIAGGATNPYPYGCVYANPGYEEFPDYDYAFRTYYQLDFSLECTTWAGLKASF